MHDWSDADWHYRAELYERLPHPIASVAALTSDIQLPQSWWMALRTALDTIAAVRTQRHTTTTHLIDRNMRNVFGHPLHIASAVSWSTAHGDLHWANLCGPQLRIIDWEGWGMAPTGYDAAMLYAHSLLVPNVAHQVRHHMTNLLGPPTGRIALLIAITELLDSPARTTQPTLAQRWSQLAHKLLRTASMPT